MPRIHNVLRSRYLGLSLYEDPKSNDWIRYTLEYGTIEQGEHRALEHLSDSELFFDASIDPEIPNLIAQMKDLLTGKIPHFTFQPIDERDFVLEMSRIDAARFSLHLSSDCFDTKANQFLSYSFIVSKEELARFSSQLSAEYAMLRSL